MVPILFLLLLQEIQMQCLPPDALTIACHGKLLASITVASYLFKYQLARRTFNDVLQQQIPRWP